MRISFFFLALPFLLAGVFNPLEGISHHSVAYMGGMCSHFGFSTCGLRMWLFD